MTIVVTVAQAKIWGFLVCTCLDILFWMCGAYSYVNGVLVITSTEWNLNFNIMCCGHRPYACTGLHVGIWKLTQHCSPCYSLTNKSQASSAIFPVHPSIPLRPYKSTHRHTQVWCFCSECRNLAGFKNIPIARTWNSQRVSLAWHSYVDQQRVQHYSVRMADNDWEHGMCSCFNDCTICETLTIYSSVAPAGS